MFVGAWAGNRDNEVCGVRLKQSWEVDEEKSEELRVVSDMSHFLPGCI